MATSANTHPIGKPWMTELVRSCTRPSGAGVRSGAPAR